MYIIKNVERIIELVMNDDKRQYVAVI